MSESCAHLDSITEITPSTRGCEECLKTGSRRVHLRICRACGHVASDLPWERRCVKGYGTSAQRDRFTKSAVGCSNRPIAQANRLGYSEPNYGDA